VILTALVTSCTSRTGAPRHADPVKKAPVIYTTTYPMKYFVERIGRGRARVHCPVPANPEAFLQTISPEVIKSYQKADLIVMNGAGYDKWVAMACLPESRIVDTAKPFENEFIELEAAAHSHGESGFHTHEGVDGHTWLDPVYARIQAEEIKKAMTRRFPDHAAEFEKGCSSLAEDLAELDRLFSGLAKRYDGRPILAAQPSYNYIARRYGWDTVNLKLSLDPTEMPDDGTFAELRRVLAAHRAKFILWEKRPAADIAERIEKELGLRSVEFSPCKELSEEDVRDGLNYLGVMRRNAENITKVFTKARSGN